MIFGFLMTLYILLSLLLIPVILVQKSKSSMGLGGLGGSAQMLFGGSGGQDLFQKATWVMVALFMSGSFLLALMKSTSHGRYDNATNVPFTQQAPAQSQQTAPE
jgi:protein translocase SecG subunit